MPRTFSGKQIIAVLVREYGFRVIGQRGSHAKLRKLVDKRKVTTVVPMHKEVARGTLRGLLDLAEVDYRDFLTRAS